MRFHALVILTLLVSSGPSSAEIEMRKPPTSAASGGSLADAGTADMILTHKVTLMARSNEPTSALRTRVLGMLRATDVDGNPGFTEDDVMALVDRKVAEARSRILGPILRYDLDGDLTITSEEIASVADTEARQPIRRANTEVLPTEDQIAEAINQTLAKVLANDLDGDGSITPAEVDALAERQRGGFARSPGIRSKILPWDFDTDGNGRITPLEVERAVRTAVAYIDVNGDGILARDEVVKAQNTLRGAINQRDLGTQQRAGGKCELPQAPKGAEKVVLFAPAAGALSNLKMEREGTKPVGYVELAVQEDARELWVYTAFAEPVVIRVTGPEAARARVKTVTAMNRPVVVADAPGAEVVEARCVFGFLGITTGPESIEQRYASAIGDRVRMFSGESIGRVDLASGSLAEGPLIGDDTPDAPGAAPLLALFQRFRPNGFQIVQPESVKGYRAVEPATVWPEEAGLLEHVRTGAMRLLNSETAIVAQRAARGTPLAASLEKASRGSDRVQSGDTVYWMQPDGSWLGYEKIVLGVTRAIDMPHGLQNRRIRIILGPGVPRPRGGELSPTVRN